MNKSVICALIASTSITGCAQWGREIERVEGVCGPDVSCIDEWLDDDEGDPSFALTSEFMKTGSLFSVLGAARQTARQMRAGQISYGMVDGELVYGAPNDVDWTFSLAHSMVEYRRNSGIYTDATADREFARIEQHRRTVQGILDETRAHPSGLSALERERAEEARGSESSPNSVSGATGSTGATGPSGATGPTGGIG